MFPLWLAIVIICCCFFFFVWLLVVKTDKHVLLLWKNKTKQKTRDFPGSPVIKTHFHCRICLQCGRPGFDPWVGTIPWRRERLLSPVFLPGEFHGLYSPWGCKELDTNERLSLSLSTAGRANLIPGEGTKILHATWPK